MDLKGNCLCGKVSIVIRDAKDLFDRNDHLRFNSQIYIDNKPSNYAFANQTEMFTEEEILKRFGP